MDRALDDVIGERQVRCFDSLEHPLHCISQLPRMLTVMLTKRGKQGGRNRGRYNHGRDGARKV